MEQHMAFEAKEGTTGDKISPAGHLVQEIVADLISLKESYLSLLQLRMQGGIHLAVRGAVSLILTLTFGLVGICELLYAGVGLTLAEDPINREQAFLYFVCGLLCLLLAGCASLIGYAALKRLRRGDGLGLAPLSP